MASSGSSIPVLAAVHSHHARPGSATSCTPTSRYDVQTSCTLARSLGPSLLRTQFLHSHLRYTFTLFDPAQSACRTLLQRSTVTKHCITPTFKSRGVQRRACRQWRLRFGVENAEVWLSDRRSTAQTTFTFPFVSPDADVNMYTVAEQVKGSHMSSIDPSLYLSIPAI